MTLLRISYAPCAGKALFARQQTQDWKTHGEFRVRIGLFWLCHDWVLQEVEAFKGETGAANKVWIGATDLAECLTNVIQ